MQIERGHDNSNYHVVAKEQHIVCNPVGYIRIEYQMMYHSLDYLWNPDRKHLSIVCPFGIGTLASRKKREKLFWDCIFARLNLKMKIDTEGQYVCCFSHIEDSGCYLYCLRAIKLNLWPTTPFLAYMHVTSLTFGKPFVRKHYHVLVFWIVPVKSVEIR